MQKWWPMREAYGAWLVPLHSRAALLVACPALRVFISHMQLAVVTNGIKNCLLCL